MSNFSSLAAAEQIIFRTPPLVASGEKTGKIVLDFVLKLLDSNSDTS